MLLIEETQSSMLAKRDITMKVAVLLIAAVVFAILLTLDTGALLSWALLWMIRGVAHWWVLLFVPLAVIVVRVWQLKRRSTPARPRVSPARPSGRSTPRHLQKSTAPRRRRKPTATKGQR
jgi:hypothetical protein